MFQQQDFRMGRVMPHDLLLEEAVLGACLLEKETFETVSGIIQNPEVFYGDKNKKIYTAMCEMQAAGSAIDLLTVTDWLTRKNELEKVGGIYGLNRLSMAVLSSAHATTHSRIIYEFFIRREIIRISSENITKAYDLSQDAFEVLDDASVGLESILNGVSVDTYSGVGEIYQQVLKEIEVQQQSKRELVGITSGYDELDSLTAGWEKTNLIILAARPSNGKTAFALNLAANAATGSETNTEIKPSDVLFFSLESTSTSLVKRMASAKSEVPLENIRRGTLELQQNRELNRLTSHFYKLPIKIDSRSRKLSDIKRVARKWNKKRKSNLKEGIEEREGLIIIDYLQLMSIQGKGNREQEISTISRDLKELAVELNVSIIALSQLNREVEKTADKKPGLHHLRESGSLEQDANVAMFIWWEDTGTKDANDKPILKVKILVEKSRDGKTGEVELKFSGDIQRWENLEENPHNVYNDIPSGVATKFQANANRYGKDDDNNPF